MIKVIETNLSIQVDNTIIDHQSRVIEVESWKDYIEEIKSAKTVIRNSVIGALHGATIPKEAKIENLIYDDFHLKCEVINWLGIRSIKLAYKV
ncbi:MAG: hypothetical protein PHT02_00505 [Tissierellia bacterium]|nr:hypothetical protein [Tissierellia bacterium]